MGGSNVAVMANAWGVGTITTFLSGTPASGIVQDKNGGITNYSSFLRSTNGSSSAPAYSFSANTNQGLFSSNNLPEIAVGGFGMMAWDTSGSRMRVNGCYGWSPFVGDPDGSANDTGFRRDSADVIDVGNCAASDTSGKLQAAGYISKGTAFSASGCTNSNLTGGATAGSFKVGQNTNCTIVITMGSSATAPNGWICSASDETAVPAQAIRQTSHSATSCSLNMTVATNDIIVFSAEGW